MLDVLELFSGVGGWRFALEASGADYRIVGAFDVSTAANKVYNHNCLGRLGTTTSPAAAAVAAAAASQKAIERLTLEELDGGLRADMWVMSPPCQPHTRNNTTEKRDACDPRSVSFLHLINALPQLRHRPKTIILENVCGFESSDCCEQWRQSLAACGYCYLQFHLTPISFGVPNDRPRYFGLAFLQRSSSSSECSGLGGGGGGDGLLKCVPSASDVLAGTVSVEEEKADVNCVGGYLELPNDRTTDEQSAAAVAVTLPDSVAPYVVPASVLSKPASWCLDIVTASSLRSACFTKSYTRYLRGTGSVLLLGQCIATCEGEGEGEGGPASDSRAPESSAVSAPLLSRAQVASLDLQCPEEREYAEGWAAPFQNALRYFTPREVANLLGFPPAPAFEFPADVAERKRYELLGNSLHVGIATELVRLALDLVNDDGDGDGDEPPAKRPRPKK